MRILQKYKAISQITIKPNELNWQSNQKTSYSWKARKDKSTNLIIDFIITKEIKSMK
jgi:hypothetical protein